MVRARNTSSSESPRRRSARRATTPWRIAISATAPARRARRPASSSPSCRSTQRPARGVERRGAARAVSAACTRTRLPAGAAGQLADGALGDEPAAADDHDVVDGLRDLGEHVAGDQHRAALGGAARAGSRAASGCPAGRGRWRARRGPAPRVAEQRAGEPEPLAHAERVPARAPVGRARRARPARSTSSTREARQPAPSRASARRWSRPLRPGCAPATSSFAPTRRAGSLELARSGRPSIGRVAGGRPRQPEQHPQRRRLAGAVRAEEAGDRPGPRPRTTGRRRRGRRRSPS